MAVVAAFLRLTRKRNHTRTADKTAWGKADGESPRALPPEVSGGLSLCAGSAALVAAWQRGGAIWGYWEWDR